MGLSWVALRCALCVRVTAAVAGPQEEAGRGEGLLLRRVAEPFLGWRAHIQGLSRFWQTCLGLLLSSLVSAVCESQGVLWVCVMCASDSSGMGEAGRRSEWRRVVGC